MSSSQDKVLRFAELLAKGELTDAVEDGVVGEPWSRLAEHLEKIRREWQAERGAAVEQAVRQVTALSDVANRDGLTGLLNRRAMTATLTKEVRRAKADNKTLAVAMIDLDHFKRTNDTFGHAAGDAVLCAVGRLLKDSVREGDSACRPGGEEFVLVLPGITPRAAYARLSSLVGKIRALPITHDGRVIQTTASVGLACFPQEGEDMESLLRLADEAMYRAKTSGRDRLAPPPANLRWNDEQQAEAGPAASDDAPRAS